MNQITGASQTTASPPPQTLPPESFGQLGRIGDALAPADPNVTREQWLEQARTSADPVLRAFYNELVTLAGGRKDDAALNQVIDRYQALQNASTASEVQAAERGWLDQIGTMLSRFDPLNNLLNAVQPHLADMTRAAGLAETAWGASLQRVLDAPGSAAAFNDGLRAGILAGGKEMIVGTATTVGGLVQYGADTSLAGRAGDALRGLTGPLPGVIDAAVPSRARGAATSEALADMGGKIGTYLGAVADNPARLKTDIANTIDAQWSRLEASHAAAAARGPQAEARWWGETVGRVTFEVAAAVVPVTKVGTVANAANGAADLARAANTLDGAAAAAARAADGAGNTVVDGARIAGRTDVAGGAARVVDTVDDAERLVGVGGSWVRFANDLPVFRGDRRDPSIVFDQGFAPRGGTDDLADYVGNHVDSNFVSTSTSIDVARDEYYTGGKGGWVYDIDPALAHGGGIDVNATLGNHPMAFEKEIAFHQGIPREAISGARQVLDNGSLGRFIRNPFYGGN